MRVTVLSPGCKISPVEGYSSIASDSGVAGYAPSSSRTPTSPPVTSGLAASRSFDRLAPCGQIALPAPVGRKSVFESKGRRVSTAAKADYRGRHKETLP